MQAVVRRRLRCHRIYAQGSLLVRNRQRKRRLQQDWETLTVRLHPAIAGNFHMQLYHLCPAWRYFVACTARRHTAELSTLACFSFEGPRAANLFGIAFKESTNPLSGWRCRSASASWTS
jgi:hypothetical protein